MTPRPTVFWRDVAGGLGLLCIAAGALCLAFTAVVICSPYLLVRWLWCLCTGRPW